MADPKASPDALKQIDTPDTTSKEAENTVDPEVSSNGNPSTSATDPIGADIDITTRSRIAAEKLAAQDLKYKQLQQQLDDFRGKIDATMAKFYADLETKAAGGGLPKK